MRQEQKNIFLKKLFYQSKNRGCKETELILKNFTDKYLTQMSFTEMQEFELILQQTDLDLYDWLCKKSSPPKNLLSKTMQKLIND